MSKTSGAGYLAECAGRWTVFFGDTSAPAGDRVLYYPETLPHQGHADCQNGETSRRLQSSGFPSLYVDSPPALASGYFFPVHSVLSPSPNLGATLCLLQGNLSFTTQDKD